MESYWQTENDIFGFLKPTPIIGALTILVEFFHAKFLRGNKPKRLFDSRLRIQSIPEYWLVRFAFDGESNFNVALLATG